jgi:hypothetical protein
MSPKLKYMNAVADHLISLGYEVETPDENNDLIDVWGFTSVKGHKRRRRCFVEIYLHAFSEMDNGLYGIWGQGESDDEELFLSSDPAYGLDTRFFPLSILDGLEPLTRKAGA